MVTKLAEGRAGNQTKRFECAPQTVTASADAGKRKKKKPREQCFPRDRSVLPKNAKSNNPSNNL